MLDLKVDFLVKLESDDVAPGPEFAVPWPIQWLISHCSRLILNPLVMNSALRPVPGSG